MLASQLNRKPSTYILSWWIFFQLNFFLSNFKYINNFSADLTTKKSNSNGETIQSVTYTRLLTLPASEDATLPSWNCSK